IRNVLDEYEAAYDRKDADRLGALWPSRGRSFFRDQFALVRTVDLTISNVQVGLAGDVATVTCEMHYRYVWMRAGPPTNSQSVTLRLRRQGAGWVIQ
ncbi:MAG: YybH family protein, partial [Acidimicrobiia bacterium]